MDDNGIVSSSGENASIPPLTIKQHSNKNNKRKNQENKYSYKKRRQPVTLHQAQRDNGAANDIQRLIQFQDSLDYLQDEWAAIDILLQSLKTAFTIYPSRMTTEDYLHNIDNELSIAVDDLMVQIRNLDRRLNKLECGMNLI